MPRLSSLTNNIKSLSPEVCKALNSIDVKSVEDVLFADQSTISHRSGISQEIIAALVLELQKLYTATPVLGSNLYWDYMYNACIIPTSSPGLDYVLDGGLWGGEMTELVGQPATGKTQICMFAALNTAKQNKTVFYIDTANSFSPERITEMFSQNSSQNIQKETVEILNRINCRKCFDAFVLMEILYDLQAKLESKEIPFYGSLKLIVIDSLGALLSPIVGGKQQQGHALMTSIARLLKEMASKFHLAVLVTNYVVSGGEGAKHKPALGMSWQQVMLSYHPVPHMPSGPDRKASLTKSSHAPLHRSVIFQIASQGIISNC